MVITIRHLTIVVGVLSSVVDSCVALIVCHSLITGVSICCDCTNVCCRDSTMNEWFIHY